MNVWTGYNYKILVSNATLQMYWHSSNKLVRYGAASFLSQ